MDAADPEPRVRNNEERRRYELWVGADLAGYSAYREPDGDGPRRLVFTHTEVDPGFGGRGLGSLLVWESVEDAVGRGYRIVPICPFVGKLLRSTSKYDEYVRWPPESRDE